MSVNPYVPLVLVLPILTIRRSSRSQANKPKSTDYVPTRLPFEPRRSSGRSAPFLLFEDKADEDRAANIDYRLISDLFRMNGLNYNNLLIISIVLVPKVKRAGRKIGRGLKRGLKRFRGNRELANTA